MKRPAKAKVGADAAVRAALGASVQRLFHNEPGAVAGNVEALHRARVAVRRMRSDLRSFRPLVDRDWSDGLRQELRWLGDEFGAVRDLDVFLDRLRSGARRLTAPDQSVRSLIAGVRSDRANARTRMVKAVRSRRFRMLARKLVMAARSPRLTLAARTSADAALLPIVARTWKRLRSAVEALRPQASIRALHRIRILAKRCRYAAEAAAITAGKPMKKLAAAAAGVQDVLGELNDAETACRRLRRLRRNPHAASAAAALLAFEQEAAARARAAWPHAWQALDDKKLRAWL